MFAVTKPVSENLFVHVGIDLSTLNCDSFHCIGCVLQCLLLTNSPKGHLLGVDPPLSLSAGRHKANPAATYRREW